MSQVNVDSTIVENETVQRYFEQFNAGEFATIAPLFTDDAAIHAPLKTEITGGGSAIAEYLQAQAKGMIAIPEESSSESDDRSTDVQVIGRVLFAGFKIKMQWLFLIDRDGKIYDLTIKMLASTQELMNMRGVQPK